MNALTQIDQMKQLAPKKSSLAGVRITTADFFLPLAIIGGLALLLLTMGTHFAVSAFDRSSAIREQILVQNGIAQRIDEVAAMVVPQTTWDDATAHLDNRFDARWAAANIGKYLSQTDGIDLSYVIDRDNHVIFASRGGLESAKGTYPEIGGLADPLISKVRAQERARGPLRKLASGGMISHAIQASSLNLIEGKLSILTATLVQPDFGTALPQSDRSPIVITSMHVNQDFLDAFARRYMLDGLHIRAPGDPQRSGEVEIPARDNHGKTLAYLAWKPLDPGYSMLRVFLPAIGIVLLLMGAMAYYQLRKVHLAARELLTREADYSALLSELASSPDYII